jgi:hypothetical protein
MLIKEVRRVYEDLNASEPKKYGHHEWAYFLELLVEDEEDPKYHRKAPLKLENNDLKKSTDNSSAVTAEEQEVDKSQDGGQKHAASEASETIGQGKRLSSGVGSATSLAARRVFGSARSVACWALP